MNGTLESEERSRGEFQLPLSELCLVWGMRFQWRWLRRQRPYGMCRRVTWWTCIEVSEERAAFVFRLEEHCLGGSTSTETEKKTDYGASHARRCLLCSMWMSPTRHVISTGPSSVACLNCWLASDDQRDVCVFLLWYTLFYPEDGGRNFLRHAIYQTTRHRIPEDTYLHNVPRQSLKSHRLITVCVIDVHGWTWSHKGREPQPVELCSDSQTELHCCNHECKVKAKFSLCFIN
jgi:hypothetical protein